MYTSSIIIFTDDSQMAQDLHNHLNQPGYGVAGISAEDEATSTRIEELKPDLIITDFRLSHGQGIIKPAIQLSSAWNPACVERFAYFYGVLKGGLPAYWETLNR